MFDFKVWDIPGRKHNIVDRLFWKPSTVVDLVDTKAIKEIDVFIFVELNDLQVLPIFLDKPTSIHVDG